MTIQPIKIVFLVICLGTAGLGIYVYLTEPVAEKPATHAVIVIDTSDSMNVEHRQRSVATMFYNALNRRGLRHDSFITIITTGDDDTANEPRQVFTAQVPFTASIMEGREAVENAKAQLLTDVRGILNDQLVDTKSSPIFLGVKRALTALKASGCHQDGRCELHIYSDGEETEEPWLRRSMKRGKFLTQGMPEKLDNRGVTVLWCGLVEIRGDQTRERTSVRVDFLIQIWRQMFVEPDTVQFQPFCPVNLPEEGEGAAQ